MLNEKVSSYTVSYLFLFIFLEWSSVTRTLVTLFKEQYFIIHIKQRSNDQATLLKSFSGWESESHRNAGKFRPRYGLGRHWALELLHQLGVGGGAAHTAHAADGLTRSQPAAAPQSQGRLWN